MCLQCYVYKIYVCNRPGGEVTSYCIQDYNNYGYVFLSGTGLSLQRIQYRGGGNIFHITDGAYCMLYTCETSMPRNKRTALFEFRFVFTVTYKRNTLPWKGVSRKGSGVIISGYIHIV